MYSSQGKHYSGATVELSQRTLFGYHCFRFAFASYLISGILSIVLSFFTRPFAVGLDAML